MEIQVDILQYLVGQTPASSCESSPTSHQ